MTDYIEIDDYSKPNKNNPPTGVYTIFMTIDELCEYVKGRGKIKQ